jgi:hypothetical protein
MAIKFKVQTVCIDINLGRGEGDNFTPRLRQLLSLLYTPNLDRAFQRTLTVILELEPY